MARPKKSDPKYRYHVSGQAVVTLAGKDFYLGQHDTPESRAKYHKLLAKFNANGLRAPDQVSHHADKPFMVQNVTAEFRELASRKYANHPEEKRWYVALCELLETKYGELPAKDFGPRKLDAIREIYVDSGNKRFTVNRKASGIRKIFKYAVAMEVIEHDVTLGGFKIVREPTGCFDGKVIPSSRDGIVYVMGWLLSQRRDRCRALWLVAMERSRFCIFTRWRRYHNHCWEKMK